MADVAGYILICFGEISRLKQVVEKKPEELQKEEDKEVDPLFAKLAKRQQAKKDLEAKEEAPKPISVTMFLTSIHDFLQAIEKMQDFDYTLAKLGILKADLEAEINQKEEKEVKEEVKKEEIKEEVKKAVEEKTDEEEIFGGEDDEAGSPRRDEEEGKQNFKDQQFPKAENQPKRQETKGRIKSPPEAKLLYSSDIEYENKVKTLNELDVIPDAPEKAKNAFGITIFILEQAFESRACDFLKFAFELFPDKDYMIITQPHVVPESSLLKNFTLVEKKAESTFSHVLYVLHKDSLLGPELRLRLADTPDYDKAKDFLQNLSDSKEMINNLYEVLVKKEASKQCFLTTLGDDIIGEAIITKDVNLPYYKSHFHIQEYMLLQEHERTGHKRLIMFVLNPIFEKSARFVLREIMRLSSSTCLYMELHENSVVPPIVSQLIYVKTRRFPHFLKMKWNHERSDLEEVKNFSKDQDGGDRDPVDEEESKFTLLMTTQRLLSEAKIVNNSRIVVVGSSDTGISFVERLLSLRYMQFTNITLLAPGGMIYLNVKDQSKNLKASSTSYTVEEIERLMLESRIKVINARMIDIDRQQKCVILHDESIIPYDILILTMGLQDNTLQSLKYVSRGIAPIPQDYLHVEGLISLDDPYLYQHLRDGGTIISMLSHRKKPEKCVIYGRHVNCLTLIQGLIKRGVRPSNITYAIPDLSEELETPTDEYSLNPKAFYDKDAEQMIFSNLQVLGVHVIKDVLLKKIEEDEKNTLTMAIFEKQGEMPAELAAKAEKNSEDEIEEDSKSGEEDKKEGAELNWREVKCECRVLFTSGHRDVDIDVFNALHNNSLVYNGRLVVDNNFQVLDFLSFFNKLIID